MMIVESMKRNGLKVVNQDYAIHQHQDYEHDPDYDLVHELSDRLKLLSRYAQYSKDAAERSEVKVLWISLELQEKENVARLKSLIGSLDAGHFGTSEE